MHKLFLALVAAVISATSFWSCQSDFVDPSAEAYTRDTAAISAYVKTQSQSLSFVSVDNYAGIRYAITRINPTGDKPTAGEELEFKYTIKLLDATNTVVDAAASDTSIFFPYGLNAMLAGLEIGFSKMREGETATFLFPSIFAFGNQTALNGKLPPNTPVRFDVELIKSRSEDEQIESFITRNKFIVMDKQTTGLRILKTTPPTSVTGAALVDGQAVTVKYTGRLLRAAKAFDSGSIEVTLGRNQTVAGFETGIKALKVGEKATLVFPSSLGYGSSVRRDANGNVAIPPYSPLAFDIEVVSVK